MPNVFENLPAPASLEHFTTLFAGKGARIERIISHGHTTPVDTPYTQNYDEWILLLAGAARLWIDGSGTHELRPGDYMLISARQRHSVTWTSEDEPTVWLAIHFN